MAIKNSGSSSPQKYQQVSDWDDSSKEVKWLKKPDKSSNKFSNPLERRTPLKARFQKAKTEELEKHGDITRAEDAWKLLGSCQRTFASLRTDKEKPLLNTMAELSAHLKLLGKSGWVDPAIVREGKNLVNQMLLPPVKALRADERLEKLYAIDQLLESALMGLESSASPKPPYEGRGIFSSSEALDAMRKTSKE